MSKNCNSLCKDLRKSNVSKHIRFAQNHITKAPPFACHPKCLLGLLQHSQEICNTLFISWISAIEKSNDALDKLIQQLKPSPDVRRELLVHACTIGLPALARPCAWITHIMLCYSQKSRCMCSISYNHLEVETMVRPWEQNNYLKSSIPWFHPGVDLGAASCLVTRLESPVVKTEHLCYLEVFPLPYPLLTWLTAICWCCKQVLNHISCQKFILIHSNSSWMAR